MNSRRGAVALVVAVALAALVVGCGGGNSSGGDNPSGDDLARKVSDTISQPGMVYHAVASDGSEVWLDAADQLYVRTEATSLGVALSVGEGWKVTSYDPSQNAVSDTDNQPKAGSATPRINNPGVSWTEALSALAFGNALEFMSRSTADGVDVYVVQAHSPIVDKNGAIAGSLTGRVEIDVQTSLPHAFEGRETDLNGATATPVANGLAPNPRIVYTTSEMIPRSSLPATFFDKAQVAAQVQTPQEGMDKIRALGLTPLWLGEQHEGDGGVLKLPIAKGISSDATNKRGEVHYSLIVPISSTDARAEGDSVIIALAADAIRLTAPSIPQFAGALPEKKASVTVNGGPATLYTSILTPNDLGCDPGATCPQTDAKLYRRLIFAVGTTNVQVSATARIGAGGQDANGYNSDDAIIALAEALTEAPQSTPTPAPSS